MLAERDLLKGGAGRDAFAVLLFQDLAFIPIVAIVPLLADGAKLPDHVPWHDVPLGIAGIALILVGGRFVLPPLFRLVGGGRNQEVFTVTSLFVVVAAAFVATQVGLSASLGVPVLSVFGQTPQRVAQDIAAIAAGRSPAPAIAAPLTLAGITSSLKTS